MAKPSVCWAWTNNRKKVAKDKSSQMLYFLLIIIAVGVLLLSEAGQGLLKLFFWLALIGGVLYLLFGLGVFGWVFFNSETGQATLGVLIIVLVGLGITIWVNKKWKERHQIIPDLRKDIKKFWLSNWTNATIKNRIGVICGIFLIFIIIFTWIIVPILFPD